MKLNIIFFSILIFSTYKSTVASEKFDAALIIKKLEAKKRDLGKQIDTLGSKAVGFSYDQQLSSLYAEYVEIGDEIDTLKEEHPYDVFSSTSRQELEDEIALLDKRISEAINELGGLNVRPLESETHLRMQKKEELRELNLCYAQLKKRLKIVNSQTQGNTLSTAAGAAKSDASTQQATSRVAELQDKLKKSRDKLASCKAILADLNRQQPVSDKDARKREFMIDDTELRICMFQYDVDIFYPEQLRKALAASASSAAAALSSPASTSAASAAPAEAADAKSNI